MIITRLSGGLGNQMFQYAFGCAQAALHKTELKLDLSGYTGGKEERKFMLDQFDIVPAPKQASFFERIFKKKFREVETTFSTRFAGISDGIFIGNWQSEKYFADVSQKMRESFQLKKSSLYNTLSIRPEENSVSIHIRRGDYASDKRTSAKHGLLPLEYYKQAIQAISEKVQNPHFCIFSDDVAWVEANLPLPGDVTWVSGTGLNEAEELILMSKCKHNIIANSTYSWWGAWLNPNPEKIVIAPKTWFLTTADTSDLIPGAWTRI